MHPVYFDGSKEMAKPVTMTDEQCYSLWAHQHDYKHIGEDGQEHNGRVWTEVWQPFKEDIEAIVAGRPVILQIHSAGLPPVSLFTLDQNGQSNNE